MHESRVNTMHYDAHRGTPWSRLGTHGVARAVVVLSTSLVHAPRLVPGEQRVVTYVADGDPRESGTQRRLDRFFTVHGGNRSTRSSTNKRQMQI